jgi:Putative DNA-binding domain
MSKTTRDLDRIQRWMQAVVMHPDGVPEGIDSAEARRHIDVAPDAVETVVTRSRGMSATERLAIYNGAYFARLLECLRDEFRVLVHALGEEVFDEFAFGYLQAYPSRSYTLNRLGLEFPHYLAETAPDRESEEDASADWQDFLIDLATLESAYNEVFDGPGVEGTRILDAEQLAAFPPRRWPDARLKFVNCFRLLTLRCPAHEYYSAVRNEEEAVLPQPAETFLAITRRDFVVCRYPLSKMQYDLLKSLAEGEAVQQAIGRAAETADSDLDTLAADLRDWFAAWAAAGFFQAVEVPQ